VGVEAQHELRGELIIRSAVRSRGSGAAIPSGHRLPHVPRL